MPSDKRQQSVSYTVKDIVGRSGFGIGSAGLPAYSLLIEGRTEALQDDVVLSMKQGNVAAPSRVVTDEAITQAFHHHGHRTVVSQRALQAHADPWLGWCELDGTGFVVSEVSPYEEDLDWDLVASPDEIEPLVQALGQATAKVHCVPDASSDQELVDFDVEAAITEAIGDRVDEFADDVAGFGSAYAELVREDHRRFVDAFRNGAIPGLPVDYVRLAKYLAHSGVASRRAAERLIAAGDVTVGGQVVTDPARDVDESSGSGGRRAVAPEAREVHLLNKPAGVVSTAADTHGRRTVVEYVASRRRLYPVGRLDVDTTGLILLTNDGALADRLTHPRYGVQKTYRASVRPAEIADEAVSRLRAG